MSLEEEQISAARTSFLNSLMNMEIVPWECGNRDGDFQGLWALRETCLWFSSASIAVISTAVFHALLFSRISANNFRFASCIRRAAAVSLSFPASCSKPACSVPGFRRRAKPGTPSGHERWN